MTGPRGGQQPFDYASSNLAYWTGEAPAYATYAQRHWNEEPAWGVFRVPESEVGLLRDVEGRDAIELGCGTAYVSAWLANRGARPVGLDLTPAQLSTARAMQHEVGPAFPLIRGVAEHLPFRDASFDLAISEYGAAIWSDPHRWIPEAARVLRPGGELRMLGTSVILTLCAPDLEEVPVGLELQRAQRGLHRLDWPDIEGIEFHISHGERIRLLRRHGFEVLDLIELYPPADRETGWNYVTLEWARQWPAEEVWIARKRA
ncbi:MAG: class I SAM-dependent methyltransferase [Dehalococcoidia bacterium]